MLDRLTVPSVLVSFNSDCEDTFQAKNSNVRICMATSWQEWLMASRDAASSSMHSAPGPGAGAKNIGGN